MSDSSVGMKAFRGDERAPMVLGRTSRVQPHAPGMGDSWDAFDAVVLADREDDATGAVERDKALFDA